MSAAGRALRHGWFGKGWSGQLVVRVAKRQEACEIDGTDPVGQPCPHDFDIYSETTLLEERTWGKTQSTSEKMRWEKLRYLHRNPVEERLVDRTMDWPWRSARFYEQGSLGGRPPWDGWNDRPLAAAQPGQQVVRATRRM